MYFYKTIILGICVFISGISSAQRCVYPTGLELSSNNDINNFSTNHPNCKTIVGDLRIIGPISSLNGLSSIDTILGNLTILTGYGWNDDFLNFEGINNLKYISNDLRIQGNQVLVDDRGFDSLNHIGGALEFYGNPSLKKIHSFKLKKMPGSIDIRDNDSLELVNITSLASEDTLINFILENNKLLITIGVGGLDKIQIISGQLIITKMPSFKSMPSFKNLDSIDHLYIRYMDSLEDLRGLENVKQIEAIVIIDNPKIRDISSIKNAFIPLYFGNITIQRNPSLEICNYYHICNYLNVRSTNGQIWENKGSCYNRDSIVEACKLSSINQLNSGNFKIYPNPTTDIIYLESLQGVKIQNIELFNTLGKEQPLVLKDYHNFNIQHLNAGLYFIKITTNNNSQIFKIIKQ